MKPDAELQRHVIEEFDFDPSIDAARIGITVEDGVVTLTGHVPTFAEKLAAEEVAKRVHGVRAVANEIEVRPTGSHTRDDAALAAAAVHCLEWDSSVPHDQLQVTVRDGAIVLEGVVDWHHQHNAAESAVRRLVGAREVINKIRVMPPATSREIKARIEAAMVRSATLDSKRIRVAAEEGVVTLTGDVHSHAEREEAARIAWAAGGVSQLSNCLTVTPWGCGPAEEWGY